MCWASVHFEFDTLDCGVPECSHKTPQGLWFSSSHHTFLKHTPSRPVSAAFNFRGRILRASQISAPLLPGTHGMGPSNSPGPGSISRTMSCGCGVCLFPGLCAHASDIPQPTVLWFFSAFLIHCELSHYLFLPDLLWTDFSAPKTSRARRALGKECSSFAHEIPLRLAGGWDVGRLWL